TPQISPSTLIGSLRTLELGSESQGASESQAPGEENLLGEAAGGQDMADSMLMQGSRGLTDQALLDVKNIAHQNKFGEDMPHPH
ncbi:HDAC6 isoform 8, partial [Pan troglodytes]